MPLPWKKTKISRLVADHIESQKRLETGFPTSLVDLFVKNRDRLKKKPSKKKRPASRDPAITPSLSPVNHLNPCPADLVYESTDSRRSSTSTANRFDTETVGRDSWPPIVRQNASVRADEESVETGEANHVLVAVLKLFVVVILALGTKRFVIWITISAFLLFFLEYVGKYLFRFYKPSSNLQNMLELLVKKLLPCYRITDVTSERVINRHKEVKPIISDSSTAEIQILEQPESNFLPSVEQTQTSDREKFTPLVSLLEVMERDNEMESACEISQLKQQNRRSSKMTKVGSKMKKLVTKKFPSSKKKHADSKNVIEGSVVNDQCQNQEQEQEKEKLKDAQQCELEFKDHSLMVSAGKSDRAEEVVDAFRTSRDILPKDSKAKTDAICSSGDSKATEVDEEVKRKAVGNLRYWFICLIVLAGLVGGKILALGLTLCWCLVLKSGLIPKKYIEDPLCRTSVDLGY